MNLPWGTSDLFFFKTTFLLRARRHKGKHRVERLRWPGHPLSSWIIQVHYRLDSHGSGARGSLSRMAVECFFGLGLFSLVLFSLVSYSSRVLKSLRSIWLCLVESRTSSTSQAVIQLAGRTSPGPKGPGLNRTCSVNHPVSRLVRFSWYSSLALRSGSYFLSTEDTQVVNISDLNIAI